ncbi:MAG: tyrosine--tRNA ligase, partial [Chloroflexi bacterium]|nr:tyrosine--tRNA ligase [Chloroflexota bacterium]
PNVGIVMCILPGTDGVIRMSKSLGNHIPLNTDAKDMYGKVMNLPDMAMPVYFRLVTSWSASEVINMEANIASGDLHPRDAKMKLAREVTERFYDADEALMAEADFVQVFQKGGLPDEMPEYKLKAEQSVLDVLLAGEMVKSRGEGRRLIKQNGVSLDGEKLHDPDQPFPHAGVLRAGKRRFLRVVE